MGIGAALWSRDLHGPGRELLFQGDRVLVSALAAIVDRVNFALLGSPQILVANLGSLLKLGSHDGGVWGSAFLLFLVSKVA